MNESKNLSSIRFHTYLTLVLFLYPALAFAGICSGPVYADQIEAENYSAMSGVVAEDTSDVDGGQNIGFIQHEDWTEYQIDVPAPGAYEIELRVASKNGGGTVNLSAGGASLGFWGHTGTLLFGRS